VAACDAFSPGDRARELTRRFGEHVALRNVALSVAPGEIHALLGPNGAGKTTLLRILAGLTTPSDGDVWVLGADASRAERAWRAQIGLVPSGDRMLYLPLSGLENLVFFARLHGMSRRRARARAEEVLVYVGLSHAAKLRRAVPCGETAGWEVLARHAEAALGGTRSAHRAAGAARG
jgi:ABC-type multidrug transport system ATPase subunit